MKGSKRNSQHSSQQPDQHCQPSYQHYISIDQRTCRCPVASCSKVMQKSSFAIHFSKHHVIDPLLFQIGVNKKYIIEKDLFGAIAHQQITQYFTQGKVNEEELKIFMKNYFEVNDIIIVVSSKSSTKKQMTVNMSKQQQLSIIQIQTQYHDVLVIFRPNQKQMRGLKQFIRLNQRRITKFRNSSQIYLYFSGRTIQKEQSSEFSEQEQPKKEKEAITSKKRTFQTKLVLTKIDKQSEDSVKSVKSVKSVTHTNIHSGQGQSGQGQEIGKQQYYKNKLAQHQAIRKQKNIEQAEKKGNIIDIEYETYLDKYYKHKNQKIQEYKRKIKQQEQRSEDQSQMEEQKPDENDEVINISEGQDKLNIQKPAQNEFVQKNEGQVSKNEGQASKNEEQASKNEEKSERCSQKSNDEIDFSKKDSQQLRRRSSRKMQIQDTSRKSSRQRVKSGKSMKNIVKKQKTKGKTTKLD